MSKVSDLERRPAAVKQTLKESVVYKIQIFTSGRAIWFTQPELFKTEAGVRSPKDCSAVCLSETLEVRPHCADQAEILPGQVSQAIREI